jgi:hypothetical protein
MSDNSTISDDISNKKVSNEKSFHVFLIFIFIWAFMGISAFIMSLWCFKYSSEGQWFYNIFGFLLAVTIGPFYWIYYAVMASYCKKLNTLPA